MIGILFVLAGIGLFAGIYFGQNQGNFTAFFSNITSILFVLIPFIPAVFFTLLGASLEQKARNLFTEKDRQRARERLEKETYNETDFE